MPIQYPKWITGAPTRDYDPAHGGVPLVPDPRNAATESQRFNFDSLGDLFNIGKSVDKFNEQELLASLELALPGYSDMVSQSSKNIQGELRGELPPDVLAKIYQTAAERGIAHGTEGSPNTEAATLRALGLTSLDMTNQGETNLTGAIKRTPIVQPYDITKNFLTPADVQLANLYSSIYASAPDPKKAAEAAQKAVLDQIAARRTAPTSTQSTTPSYFSPTPRSTPGNEIDPTTRRNVGDTPSFTNPRGSINDNIAPGSLNNIVNTIKPGSLDNIVNSTTPTTTSNDTVTDENGDVYDYAGNYLGNIYDGTYGNNKKETNNNHDVITDENGDMYDWLGNYLGNNKNNTTTNDTTKTTADDWKSPQPDAPKTEPSNTTDDIVGYYDDDGNWISL